jgi:O-antigen biosynthesis protein
MSDRRSVEDKKQYIDLARSDPAKLYDAAYYQHGCTVDGSAAYGRHQPWLTFYNKVAKKIVQKYRPKTAVDIGCAFGMVVEALVDRGVDAYGFDISPYAISQGREDIQPRLKVHSILDMIPLKNGQKYDIALCIEVLEHLPPEYANRAVEVLCAASDRVIFSSSPDDFDEPTHFNVLPTLEWIKLFEAYGFKPAFRRKAKYIARHAVVMQRVTGLLGFLKRF